MVVRNIQSHDVQSQLGINYETKSTIPVVLDQTSKSDLSSAAKKKTCLQGVKESLTSCFRKILSFCCCCCSKGMINSEKLKTFQQFLSFFNDSRDNQNFKDEWVKILDEDPEVIEDLMREDFREWGMNKFDKNSSTFNTELAEYIEKMMGNPQKKQASYTFIHDLCKTKNPSGQEVNPMDVVPRYLDQMIKRIEERAK